MVKSLAVLVGLAFFAAGITGFIPGATRDEMLFGTLHVNVIHNVAHIVIGIIFICSGLGSVGASRLSFRIFGIIYFILAIWGLAVAPRNILWIVFNSPPEVWLRVVIGVIFIFLGFGTSRKAADA